eukprot:447548-Rhodomonas_salina.1
MAGTEAQYAATRVWRDWVPVAGPPPGPPPGSLLRVGQSVGLEGPGIEGQGKGKVKRGFRAKKAHTAGALSGEGVR